MEICVLQIKPRNKCTYSDVLGLFQRIFTCDVKKNDYLYGFLLNNKGRYISDLFIKIKRDESNNIAELFIEVYHHRKQALISKLMMYKLGLDFELLELNYLVYYAQEPESWLKEVAKTSILYVDQDPRREFNGNRIAILEQDKLQANSVKELILKAKKDYWIAKYNYANIDGLDLEEGDLLPKFPIVSGVDSNKGCYIGQEVISMTKNVRVDNPPPYFAIKFLIPQNFKETIENVLDLCSESDEAHAPSKRLLYTIDNQNIIYVMRANIILNIDSSENNDSSTEGDTYLGIQTQIIGHSMFIAKLNEQIFGVGLIKSSSIENYLPHHATTISLAHENAYNNLTMTFKKLCDMNNKFKIALSINNVEIDLIMT